MGFFACLLLSSEFAFVYKWPEWSIIKSRSLDSLSLLAAAALLNFLIRAG